MSNYIYQSAIELAEKIRNGEASSLDIVTAHLKQIKKHNPSLNAVVTLMEEEA